MSAYKIAAVPGDGIGVEVIAAGVEVLQALSTKSGFELDFKHFDWNSDNYLKNGYYIPEGGLEELKTFDAIFFGAVGALNVPDHISLWGLRLPICQDFDQYANVRPARVLPGVKSPLLNGDQIDWVVVRENSEGEYSGNGGRVHRGAARRSRHRSVGVHPCRGRAHSPFRLRTGAKPSTQTPDHGHQIQRPASRHGAVGRDLL